MLYAMIIPKFEAIGFIKILEGGTTKPWLVNIYNNNSIESYVVKLYTNKHNLDNNSLIKEIISSELAKSFDIQTPDYALINFSDSFISILPSDIQNDILKFDSKLFFGTKLIEPVLTTNENLVKIIEFESIALIYAFDNLILNIDRRNEKPNLLIQDKDVFVIDHELTFYYNLNNILETEWIYNYKNHLFYNYLIELPYSEKIKLFDTFQYYIESILDFKDLDEIFKELDKTFKELSESSYNPDCYVNIKTYLCKVKNNSSKFIEKLKLTIQ